MATILKCFVTPQKNAWECVKELNAGWALWGSSLLLLLWQSLRGRQKKYFQVMCFLPCCWGISVAWTVRNGAGAVSQALASCCSSGGQEDWTPRFLRLVLPPLLSCSTSTTSYCWWSDVAHGSGQLQHLGHL